jgi:thioredoxin 1
MEPKVSPITHANDNDFASLVDNEEKPVLVDFWAEWCGPCRMLAPIVERLADHFQGRIKVVKVNTDEAQITASRYAITAIPTVMIMKKGEIEKRLVGVQPFEVYERTVDAALVNGK